MKKDVLIIAQFMGLESEGRNSRFTYIAKLIKDHYVEIVTSRFNHQKKDFRDKKILFESNYRVTLIDEPGYKKNVCLKRLYSHYILSKNIKKYLKQRKKPDVIYCSIPSLSVANIVSKYAQKNKIPFIIDIQDLWPEAFKMVFKIPLFKDILFYPMQRQADSIYKRADKVVAVSNTYLNRALKVNKKDPKGLVVFLGTDLQIFDDYVQQSNIKKPDDEFWIVYIGTLGHSYNIPCVIEAIAIANKKIYDKIKFIVMGDGPLKDVFEKKAQELGIYCEFTGRLPYKDMVQILCKCDIAVNPIIKGSVASIINKVNDYAAAGLPVINTLENKEYQNLLAKYNAGINCENNSLVLAETILKLYKDKQLIQTMGKNNRLLAEDYFDRDKTYFHIVKLINQMI
ncbi:MAG: glycosyltransferase family 4 protein [Clostridiales bacterium]|nr:glycosyltransferase family 4 protein [Clostridiales bacterium]